MSSGFSKKIQTSAICPKKTPPVSQDNTFLHKPCKFGQNRSSDSREILTTARGLAENRLPTKTTQLHHFSIFLLKNYIETCSINAINNCKIKLLIFVIRLVRKNS